MVEYGVASCVLPGQAESGDHHLVHFSQHGILIAAVDGIGQGQEAANAAKMAASLLKSALDEPIISLVERCHERLRSTRGVVLSLASIDPLHGMMTWLGVGNVQGVLARNNGARGTVDDVLLLRAGVVRHVQSASGTKGLGLIAMQERVSAIGGTLRIKSRPGQGTEPLIQLTLEADYADSHRTSG
jgi:hypothetical protein